MLHRGAGIAGDHLSRAKPDGVYCVSGIGGDASNYGRIDFIDWGKNISDTNKDLSGGEDGGGGIVYPGKFIVK